MQVRKQIIFTAFLSLWLGCAETAQAQFSKIGFDPAANAGIKKIDVLEVVQQQRLIVLPRSSHGDGPAPKTAEAKAIANAKAEQDAITASAGKFEEGFKHRNSSLSSELARQLVGALQGTGYDAKVLNGQQPKKSNAGRGLDYTGINTDADAILHVVVRFAGYKDDPASSGLIPMVGIDASLFNVKDKKIVYRQVFNQGYPLIKNAEVESLPLGQEIKFATRDALLSKIDNAVDGLVQATQPVASRIAQQLAK
jgi:hypothetical protein